MKLEISSMLLYWVYDIYLKVLRSLREYWSCGSAPSKMYGLHNTCKNIFQDLDDSF